MSRPRYFVTDPEDEEENTRANNNSTGRAPLDTMFQIMSRFSQLFPSALPTRSEPGYRIPIRESSTGEVGDEDSELQRAIAESKAEYERRTKEIEREQEELRKQLNTHYQRPTTEKEVMDLMASQDEENELLERAIRESLTTSSAPPEPEKRITPYPTRPISPPARTTSPIVIEADEDEAALQEAIRQSMLDATTTTATPTSTSGTTVPPTTSSSSSYPRMPYSPGPTASPYTGEDFMELDDTTVHIPSPQPTVDEDNEAELQAALQLSLQQQKEDEQRRVAEERRRLAEAQLAQEELRRDNERRERERLRREQDAAYQESLRRDREKARQQEDMRRREQEAAQRAEQHRQQLQRMRMGLPAEPPAGQAGTVDIAVRLPSGRRVQRRFVESDRVGALLDFVESLALPPADGGEPALAPDGEAMPEKWEVVVLGSVPQRRLARGQHEGVSLKDVGLGAGRVAVSVVSAL